MDDPFRVQQPELDKSINQLKAEQLNKADFNHR
jgi:hypothetical protein